MATQSTDLSATTVTDLTAELSLANGTSYTLQAIGRVNLAEAASAPTIGSTSAYHIVTDRELVIIKQGTDNLYAWGLGRVVVTEAP